MGVGLENNFLALAPISLQNGDQGKVAGTKLPQGGTGTKLDVTSHAAPVRLTSSISNACNAISHMRQCG